MVAVLRRDFVNAWVLAKDLDAIAARDGSADLATVCAAIEENYGYPVDSVVITPDLRVVGHQNVNEPGAFDPVDYLAFLRASLARARGESVPDEEHAPDPAGAGWARPRRTLTLTAEQPRASLLELFRSADPDRPAIAFFPIDATAAAEGDRLEVSVRVGDARPAGRFELCATTPGRPGEMTPVETLAEVAPGETATMVHELERGALFGLAAMAAAGAEPGEANAFLATVTLHPR